MRASSSAPANAPNSSGDPVGGPTPDEVRRRQNLGIWAIGYAVLSSVGVVLLAADHMPWHMYLALGLAGGAYALLLVTLPRRRARWPVYLYLAVATPSLAWLCAGDWHELGFVFLLVAQVFAFVDPVRRAVIVNGLFAGATAMLAFVRARMEAASLVNALVLTSMLFGVAIVLVCYVVGLAQESQRRGRLITALEQARADLARANHDAGVMSERERFSREIHDTLAQGFTSVLMLVQGARSALDANPAAVRDRLDLAAEVARDNLREAQALVAATAPADLHDDSLDAAIARVVERLTNEVEIAGDLRIAGTPTPLDPSIQIVLLRVAQETLANVRKHAHATNVLVKLAYRAETVLLEVTDDGRGFTPGGPSGFGLRGIRQRVEQANGTVEVISERGKGTTVRVEVPGPSQRRAANSRMDPAT